ncbi:MAG: hypothetical protein Q8L14_12380 [Myxococcales bacterium]|nr:hypothetical protein [Myxococcales bacterium]
MLLTRVFVCLIVAVVTGCGSCREPKAPTPAPVLTERDTETHDGGLSADGWALPLDARWLSVKAGTRLRLKPSAQGWAVDPDGPVQLTVECKTTSEGAEPSLRAELERSRASQVLQDVSLARLEGPWLDGALAQWATSEAQHAQGRFRVVASRCDVHAWGPKQGAGLAQRLRETVLSFAGSRPKVMAELTALTALLRENAAAQARLASAHDGGYAELAGFVLMEKALVRLPPDLLAERFTLRLRLLDALTPSDCAALVRHRVDESSRILELVPEAEAARWVELTRIALSLGLSADGPPVLPTKEEVDAAIAQLVGNDEAMVATIDLLRQADSAPDDAVCDAERLRLRKILELPVERRTLLLRSLVEK